MSAEIRYSMNHAPGIVPGKPWAVRDHALGRAAQTDGLKGPLAYFATKGEAREWADEMNRRHVAGTAPAFEIENPYSHPVRAAEFIAKNTPSIPGTVKFV